MVKIRDRIRELRRIKASELLPNPKNWRVHSKPQADALRGLLAEVGYADALLAREIEGGRLMLIDGHLRAETTPSIEVPVLVLDVDESEADKILLTLDPLAGMAGGDSAMVDELLKTVSTENEAVRSLLNRVADGLERPALAPAEIAEDAVPVERARELQEKWGTASGQVWRIAEQTLVCGSCLDADFPFATLTLTDPPYNVGLDYNSYDDLQTEAEYRSFSEAWFGAVQACSAKQIITPGGNNLARWLHWFEPHHVAPWLKTNAITHGKVTHFWCWEPILFFGEKWPRKRANDVFDFAIGAQGGVADHPCPKPLKFWADLIENFSEPGDVILEPFCGSGTTLVAAHHLGRIGYGVELDAGYVAVTLERLAALGLQPALVQDRFGRS